MSIYDKKRTIPNHLNTLKGLKKVNFKPLIEKLEGIATSLEKLASTDLYSCSFETFLEEKTQVYKGKELSAMASSLVANNPTLTESDIAAIMTSISTALLTCQEVSSSVLGKTDHESDTLDLLASSLEKALNEFQSFVTYQQRIVKAAKKGSSSAIGTITLDNIKSYTENSVKVVYQSIEVGTITGASPLLQLHKDSDGYKITRFAKTDYDRLDTTKEVTLNSIKESFASNKVKGYIAETQRHSHDKGFKKVGNVISDTLTIGIGNISCIAYGYDLDGYLCLGVIDGYGRLATLVNFLLNEDVIEKDCSIPVLANSKFANFDKDLQQAFKTCKIQLAIYHGSTALIRSFASYWSQLLILRLNISDVVLKPANILNLFSAIQDYLDGLKSQFNLDPHIALDLLYYARRKKLLSSDRFSDYIETFSEVTDPVKGLNCIDFKTEFQDICHFLTNFLSRNPSEDQKSAFCQFFDPAIGYTALLPLIYLTYLLLDKPADFVDRFFNFRLALTANGIKIDPAKLPILGIEKMPKKEVMSLLEFTGSSKTTDKGLQQRKILAMLSYKPPVVEVDKKVE